MTTIEVPEDIHEQLVGFKPLLEAVLETPLELEECVQTVLRVGLDRMLAELVGEDPVTLRGSIQQLAAAHPEEIYGYVRSTMQAGALAREREALRRRIGLTPPHPRKKQ